MNISVLFSWSRYVFDLQASYAAARICPLAVFYGYQVVRGAAETKTNAVYRMPEFYLVELKSADPDWRLEVGYAVERSMLREVSKMPEKTEKVPCVTQLIR